MMSSSVFAQTEIIQDYYSNGNVKSTIAYVDGFRNGNCNYYTKDGSRFSIMGYSSGLLISFYDNGFTKSKVL